MIDNIQVQKGFEALAAVLREQILSGKIPIGELLPNEMELTARSGLSRGSVREALRVLEAEGLVATTVGRGQGRRAIRPGPTAVRNSLQLFVRGQRANFETLLETIETLEPGLCGLAARHRNDGDLANLALCLEKLEAANSPKRFVNANAQWHLAIVQASHNPMLIAIYEAISPNLLDPRVSGFVSAQVREEVMHAAKRIQEAIIARDAEAARRRMQRHVAAYRARVEPVAPKTVTL